MGRARSQDDNWFGVQDPRKRKQIQDRLAQRARRKRLAEAKESRNMLCAGTQSCESPSSESSSSDQSSLSDVSSYTTAVIPYEPPGLSTRVATSKTDRAVTATISASIYGALYQNGAMMGLACSIAVNIKSCPFGDEIPEPLRPTQLQMTVEHPTWIDRFPFPKMRDNFITLMDIIDEEEFLGDLFCLTSFTLEPGAASWDPKAWKIGKDFAAKWSYLFY